MHGLEFVLDLPYRAQVTVACVVQELGLLFDAHVLNFSFAKVDSFLRCHGLARLISVHEVRSNAHL